MRISDWSSDVCSSDLMARQEARQRAANLRPSWACLHPDRMRNADHGGCADRAEIAAVERRRIGHAHKEQPARFEAAAKLQGWQRTTQPVGRKRGGHRHAVDEYLTRPDAAGYPPAPATH